MKCPLGAAIGVMLPRTEPEQRLLGDMGERMVEKVKETGREVTEKAKGAVQEAVGTFTDTHSKARWNRGVAGSRGAPVAAELR